MLNLDDLIQSLAGEDGTIQAEELLLAATQLTDEAAAAKQAWEEERKEFLLKEAFWKAGAREAGYLAYRYRQDARFHEEGGLENGEELAAKAKEELPEFFPKRSVRLAGVRPQEGKSTAAVPDTMEGMSYAARAELFSRDPELYRKLRGF